MKEIFRYSRSKNSYSLEEAIKSKTDSIFTFEGDSNILYTVIVKYIHGVYEASLRPIEKKEKLIRATTKVKIIQELAKEIKHKGFKSKEAYSNEIFLQEEGTTEINSSLSGEDTHKGNTEQRRNKIQEELDRLEIELEKYRSYDTTTEVLKVAAGGVTTIATIGLLGTGLALIGGPFLLAGGIAYIGVVGAVANTAKNEETVKKAYLAGLPVSGPILGALKLVDKMRPDSKKYHDISDKRLRLFKELRALEK